MKCTTTQLRVSGFNLKTKNFVGLQNFNGEFFIPNVGNTISCMTLLKMTTLHREAIQKQIEQDWANREYIELITGSIKRITDFLNSFDMSCRSRLAVLNEKLTTLERRIEYLEARVTKGETLT